MNDQTTETAVEFPADRKITIQGIEFTAPQPYKPGPCELTAGEASTLNQTLAENLRNNFAVTIKRAMEEYRKANGLAADAEVAVTSLDIPGLQEEFSKYASEYEFGVRGVGTPRVQLDPVQREANDIAWEKIKGALKQKGVKINTVSEEQKSAWITQVLSKYPAITEEAKRRVDAVAGLALEGLGA